MSILTTLGLPEDPDALLADHTATLDAAYRHVGGGLAANTEVRVDDAGKIHLTGVKAVEEPPSLVDLRNRTTAMLPRVDLPEVMNIGGPHRPAEATDPPDGRMPAEWMIVQEFSGLIQYRIGWRRYLLIRPLLHRRLARRRIVERAREEFAMHSARLLNLPSS